MPPAFKSITINFDDNITQVDYNVRQVIWTTSGESQSNFDWSTKFTCALNEGYIIDTITTSSDITITNKTNTTFYITTENVSAGIINITSKSNVSKVSIDLTTLIGWDNVASGEHTISVVAKATGYRDSEKSTPITFTKASVSTGETWVLKSSGMVAPSNIIDETINFTNLIGTAFTRITIEPEGKGVNIAYYKGSNITYAVTGGDGVTGDNATLTFETAPTGALLTWLQANGTKQGGGTATAHTLTITDQYSYDTAIIVNGNTVTSPYTLQNGDVIKVPTLTKTTINGTSYSTFDESTLNISGEDIIVSRSGVEKTTEPVPYITINYTENADSGGSSVSKNWKFNGTAAFMPQMTYSNHVTISGEAYNDTTFVEDFKNIYYADDWSCITFGSGGFWDISKNQYGKNAGNILKFNTEPSGELLAFLQAHAQPI